MLFTVRWAAKKPTAQLHKVPSRYKTYTQPLTTRPEFAAMDLLTSSKVPAVGQTGALLRHTRLCPADVSIAGHPSVSRPVLCWFAGLHVGLGRGIIL